MTQAVDRLDGETDHGISCAAVTQGFDGETVLEEVTLAVDPGEILAIIGPSGTGKTTLLRILGMFHRPDHGTVRMGGTDVWSRPDRDRLAMRRRTAMVFQSPNLFDSTVYRNVSYGRRIRDGWTDRIRTNLPFLANHHHAGDVSEMLEIVGLEGTQERSISSLSAGEAQRVAFARALATGSAFLLLDEPTSELDPRNTAVIEDAIRTARGRDRGVVIATHDMHQAERLADRVAVLLDGRITEVGPADRVFTTPDDDRTRRFISGELVY